ncbi:hypothetical protein SDC9_137828 [bioreactor metagenome]|uniref:Uncharacterized protein n=1 Tax=bioreactor metagenome TaxID=1076179 RepID=A0A645DN39_9ZZZZ
MVWLGSRLSSCIGRQFFPVCFTIFPFTIALRFCDFFFVRACFFNHEIGTTKIAVLIEIILQKADFLILSNLTVVVSVKTLQTQLIIAPIPNDIIVLTQNGGISSG